MSGLFAKSSADQPVLFNIASPKVAPELVGLTDWVQGQPQSLAQLKGTVVLLEFWTFGCVNCVRTLPSVQSWYQTYGDQGFTVLGIHTPEFDYERVTENVVKAAVDRKLDYPIALDNDWATWNAYNNHYWPAQYLIDKQGLLRNVHFGEGNYELTEAAIQQLLSES